MSTNIVRQQRMYAIFVKKGRTWQRYSENCFPKLQAMAMYSGIVATMVRGGTKAEIRPIDNAPGKPMVRHLVIHDPTRPEEESYTVGRYVKNEVVPLSGVWTDQEAAKLLASSLSERE